MSLTYRAVGWNPQKTRYDGYVAAGVVGYLTIFAAGMLVVHPTATIETILIRGFGSLGLVLLHVVLSIGPLCRLDARLLPLLYNRRHLGVTMFLAAAVHGGLATFQFHALADRHPLVSLLTSGSSWLSVAGFPFEIAGAAALAILFAMAASSHDFWLHALGPRAWKTLHMGVYLAYALVVVHVAFGALQSETSPWLTAMVAAGATWVIGLHVIAARREARVDRGSMVRAPQSPARGATWIDVCGVDEIPDTRAKVVAAGGERIAVFRYGDCVSAISNVCQHQNGPLGEGRIVRGCVVCPWHGYEYLPDSGTSPPPFTEKVATFDVRIDAGRILVDPIPHPPGTRREPARLPADPKVIP
jgi:nitrite reductase/ring-hydroxylating ferredoxin subunit/DMSO/TMAO reductase YedYZ heme-binding membrane subunit